MDFVSRGRCNGSNNLFIFSPQIMYVWPSLYEKLIDCKKAI